MKLVDINDAQFEALVLKSSLPVLLECTSPECIICKTMEARIVEAATKDYLPKMVFLKLNVNENKRWQDFQVRVIPTLLYFKNGLLVARQDNFPEIDEMRTQFNALIRKEGATGGIQGEFRTVIELEHIVGKFYKFISANVKNGRVKEKFRLIYQQTLTHQQLVQAKLRQLTGENYAPGSAVKFEGSVLRPQSFSLYGALKMAIKIEEKLLVFYKRVRKEHLLPDEELCRSLLKEKTGHLRQIKKEMKFMQDKELFSVVEAPQYPSWLNKAFE
ncbi:MAG: thioredoxin domain-containing protein [Candidatus Omnitrophota bacterium]